MILYMISLCKTKNILYISGKCFILAWSGRLKWWPAGSGPRLEWWYKTAECKLVWFPNESVLSCDKRCWVVESRAPTLPCPLHRKEVLEFSFMTKAQACTWFFYMPIPLISICKEWFNSLWLSELMLNVIFCQTQGKPACFFFFF